jgi:hypothetical protein
MKKMIFLSKRKFLRITFFSILSVLSRGYLLANRKRIGINSQTQKRDRKYNLKENRKKFAFKKRRIIVNNDGNDLLLKKESEKDNPLIFINRRLSGLKNTQVDAISYCTGVFDSYTHKSPVSQARLYNGERKEFLTKYLFEMGTDSLFEVIKFCKSNNLDIFWSFRFNDTHDSQNDRELSSWKSAHKRSLMGKPGEKLGLGGSAWSALNYSKKNVREKSLEIIQDVVTRYDIDGLEIDFYRHLYIFKEVQQGKISKEKNRQKLTSLISQIRKTLDAVSVKRAKPILLIVRIPDSIEYCHDLGIDIKTWLENEYLDILIGGGYFKLNSWENLVEMGNRYDIPVYACLTPRRIHGGGSPGQKSDMLKWRGEAYRAWKAGVNGIYTFNRFDSKDDIFREIGEINVLENADRVDQESYICNSCWYTPQRWLKNGEKYLNYSEE